MHKIIRNYSICTALIGFLVNCQTLDEYSSKSNNPGLYSQLMGDWDITASYRLSGYSREWSVIPKTTKFTFRKGSGFDDENFLIRHFLEVEDKARITGESWQIADDGNLYITAYTGKKSRFTDFFTALTTYDNMMRQLPIDDERIPGYLNRNSLYFIFKNMSDCKQSEMPLRVMAGSHGCAHIYLIAETKKRS